MAFRLGRTDLFSVLESLINPRMTPRLVNVPTTSIEKIEVLVIDMMEWAYYIGRSPYTSKRIEMSEDFYELYVKYSEIVSILYSEAYRSQSKKRIIAEYMTEEHLYNIYKMYELFCYNIEQVQRLWFKEYTVNGTTLPVMVIPTSISLDRLDRPLMIVTEETDTTYNGQEVNIAIKDKIIIKDDVLSGMSKYILMAPTSLASIELPESWKESISNIRPSMSTYKKRMLIIKKLYTQYWSYGEKLIDENGSPVFLLNYTNDLTNVRDQQFQYKDSFKIDKVVLTANIGDK